MADNSGSADDEGRLIDVSDEPDVGAGGGVPEDPATNSGVALNEGGVVTGKDGKNVVAGTEDDGKGEEEEATKWRDLLYVGQKLDVLDEIDVWNEAEVVEVRCCSGGWLLPPGARLRLRRCPHANADGASRSQATWCSSTSSIGARSTT